MCSGATGETIAGRTSAEAPTDGEHATPITSAIRLIIETMEEDRRDPRGPVILIRCVSARSTL